MVIRCVVSIYTLNAVALKSESISLQKESFDIPTQKTVLAGGFNQLNIPNKVVHSYQDLEAGECCHVFILSKYILPSAYEQDIFYLRLVAKIPIDDTSPWYLLSLLVKIL